MQESEASGATDSRQIGLNTPLCNENGVRPGPNVKNSSSILNYIKKIFSNNSNLQNSDHDEGQRILDCYDDLATREYSTLFQNKDALLIEQFADCQVKLKAIDRTRLKEAISRDRFTFSNDHNSQEERVLRETVKTVIDLVTSLNGMQKEIDPRIDNLTTITKMDVAMGVFGGVATITLLLFPLSLPVVLVAHTLLAGGGIATTIVIYGVITRVYRFHIGRKNAETKKEWNDLTFNFSSLLKHFTAQEGKVMWGITDKINEVDKIIIQHNRKLNQHDTKINGYDKKYDELNEKLVQATEMITGLTDALRQGKNTQDQFVEVIKDQQNIINYLMTDAMGKCPKFSTRTLLGNLDQIGNKREGAKTVHFHRSFSSSRAQFARSVSNV